MIPGSFPNTVPSTLSPAKGTMLLHVALIHPSIHLYYYYICVHSKQHMAALHVSDLYINTPWSTCLHLSAWTKYHTLGGLNDWKIFSPFWRLGFQGQSSSWFRICGGLSVVFALWLPFHCVLMWTFLGVCARRKKGGGERLGLPNVYSHPTTPEASI